MKRIIIVGASSGLGYRIALDFAQRGWIVGIAARREEPLKEICAMYPNTVFYEKIDVLTEDAPERFLLLIDKIGGMDVVLIASGVGKQNPDLFHEIELRTTKTNVVGFTQIIDTAYNYFKDKGQEGQIAAISSVAGTKGLGMAPSYSATKRFQYIYIDALEQLSKMQGVKIKFTDIRPGFIRTPILDPEKRYPMIMTMDHAVPRIVKAILKQRRVAVVDGKWRVLVALWRLIPRWMWKRLPIKNS